jgi:Na+-transporting NADH:ubiquinone oxidoreductase subunit C
MKGNVYTICFAAILGTVCATLLTVVSVFTKDAWESNKLAEKNRNVFVSLNIEYDEKASAEELLKIYEDNIELEAIEGKPTLYKHVDNGVVKGIAVEFDGSGLWGKIKGILAFEDDLRTIKGITFYEQEETPGIGGDIALPYFRKRFVGKKIVDADGNAGIVIKAGLSKPGQNEIDGISGATMTIDKVSDMLNLKIKELISDK